MATGADMNGPFEAVVLAAGSGSRFGGGKLLASWGAGVLLEGALAAAFAAPVRDVTVVIGANADAVAKQLFLAVVAQVVGHEQRAARHRLEDAMFQGRGPPWGPRY